MRFHDSRRADRLLDDLDAIGGDTFAARRTGPDRALPFRGRLAVVLDVLAFLTRSPLPQ